MSTSRRRELCRRSVLQKVENATAELSLEAFNIEEEYMRQVSSMTLYCVRRGRSAVAVGTAWTTAKCFWRAAAGAASFGGPQLQGVCKSLDYYNPDTRVELDACYFANTYHGGLTSEDAKRRLRSVRTAYRIHEFTRTQYRVRVPVPAWQRAGQWS